MPSTRVLVMLRCWFCHRATTVLEVERDGIIRSRRTRAGGPYRLLVCSECGRENVCERTPRGRWFASPNVKVSVFEHFFSQMLDTRPEDFLRAAAWYNDNEERRRYFFERDGDRRYSSSWFGLWRPQLRPEASDGSDKRTATSRTSDGQRAAHDGEARTQSGDSARRKEDGPSDRSDTKDRRKRATHARYLSPYEVLGVHRTASDAEIRAAFVRLARRHHPDKVYHLGEDEQRAAHARFTELKEAYERLARERTQDD